MYLIQVWGHKIPLYRRVYAPTLLWGDANEVILSVIGKVEGKDEIHLYSATIAAYAASAALSSQRHRQGRCSP